MPLLTWRLTDPSRNANRMKSLRRLQDFLGGSLRGHEIVHICPYGCHNSLESAQEEFIELMMALFFRHPLPFQPGTSGQKPGLRWCGAPW